MFYEIDTCGQFYKTFFNIIYTICQLASENSAWYNHSAYFVTIVTCSYKLQVTTEIANSAYCAMVVTYSYKLHCSGQFSLLCYNRNLQLQVTSYNCNCQLAYCVAVLTYSFKLNCNCQLDYYVTVVTYSYKLQVTTAIAN